MSEALVDFGKAQGKVYELRGTKRPDNTGSGIGKLGNWRSFLDFTLDYDVAILLDDGCGSVVVQTWDRYDH